MKRCGFGYLKVDYNENIGIGCDGAESLGEGLRQHIEGVYAFFQKIRREVPDIVIEICSSGGHRLEPSMLSLGSMGSFSDAHECLEIPVIAANLHRLILPQQNQIWAVLRKNDSQRRIAYSLANTFMGRMCISGDVDDLNTYQWEKVIEGCDFYNRIRHIIRDGISLRYGPDIRSYRHLRGWQGLLRMTADGNEAYMVLHSFAQPPERIELMLPETGWQVSRVFNNEAVRINLEGNTLIVSMTGEFNACGIHLSYTA